MSIINSQQIFYHKRRWLASAVSLAAFMVLLAVGGWMPDFKKLLLSAYAISAGKGEGVAESSDSHAHEGEEQTASAHSEAGHAGETETSPETAGLHANEAKPKYDHPHDEASSLTLSNQAKANIGLQLTRVELKPFERTVAMPGMVIERPGWSTLEITAPMTGVITRIRTIQGEAVKAGQPLFEIRLTHEDLLQLQTEFLRTVEELDVIRQEVSRLEKAAADGAIAGKTLLERKYEQQKQQAALRSQRQALLLHGLTAQQVDNIVSQRTLLQSVTVGVPATESNPSADDKEQRLQVQQLKVTMGKYVSAGDILCVLANHGELYIEGKAFEQDAEAINQAAAKGWKVSAAIESKDAGGDATEGLKILYLDDRVDPESRAFHFYVSLPNKLTRSDRTPDGRQFIYWQYKPGQRMMLKIPVQHWTDRIVLPIEAVVQEGPECYVFQSYGDHLDRRAVHVEYRDQQWAVIANDGAIAPGDQIAASAAHQMQMALRNKSGGAVDPHAGHNH
jgi:membrane fusion protein, heavy metal efflux system